jgi:hypothetical protein
MPRRSRPQRPRLRLRRWRSPPRFDRLARGRRRQRDARSGWPSRERSGCAGDLTDRGRRRRPFLVAEPVRLSALADLISFHQDPTGTITSRVRSRPSRISRSLETLIRTRVGDRSSLRVSCSATLLRRSAARACGRVAAVVALLGLASPETDHVVGLVLPSPASSLLLSVTSPAEVALRVSRRHHLPSSAVDSPSVGNDETGNVSACGERCWTSNPPSTTIVAPVM